MKWRTHAGILVLCCIFAVVSCSGRESAQLQALTELEQDSYKGQNPSEESIRELESAVREYEEKVNQLVEDTGQLGVYYKMLAVKYMEQEMYGPAMESLEKAIHIYPENPVLFYLGGVLSGRNAKARIEREERIELLEKAGAFYRRAISLNASYSEALYGLAVLYVFELQKPEEAGKLLEQLLAVESRNYDAMFLLARVYAEAGRVSEAVALYDTIIRSSASETYREQARVNRNALNGGSYGAS